MKEESLWSSMLRLFKIVASSESYGSPDVELIFLKLTFQAERPPPPQIVRQELLMAADEMGEYF